MLGGREDLRPPPGAAVCSGNGRTTRSTTSRSTTSTSASLVDEHHEQAPPPEGTATPPTASGVRAALEPRTGTVRGLRRQTRSTGGGGRHGPLRLGRTRRVVRGGTSRSSSIPATRMSAVDALTLASPRPGLTRRRHAGRDHHAGSGCSRPACRPRYYFDRNDVAFEQLVAHRHPGRRARTRAVNQRLLVSAHRFDTVRDGCHQDLAWAYDFPTPPAAASSQAWSPSTTRRSTSNPVDGQRLPRPPNPLLQVISDGRALAAMIFLVAEESPVRPGRWKRRPPGSPRSRERCT